MTNTTSPLTPYIGQLQTRRVLINDQFNRLKRQEKIAYANLHLNELQKAFPTLGQEPLIKETSDWLKAYEDISVDINLTNYSLASTLNNSSKTQSNYISDGFGIAEELHCIHRIVSSQGSTDQQPTRSSEIAEKVKLVPKQDIEALLIKLGILHDVFFELSFSAQNGFYRNLLVEVENTVQASCVETIRQARGLITSPNFSSSGGEPIISIGFYKGGIINPSELSTNDAVKYLFDSPELKPDQLARMQCSHKFNPSRKEVGILLNMDVPSSSQ